MQILATENLLSFPAGQIIQMESEPLDRVFVLVEGLAKVRSVQYSGYEEVLSVLGPGDCMGLSCLFGACAAWGDVVAITPLKGLRVTCSDVQRLMVSSDIENRATGVIEQ